MGEHVARRIKLIEGDAKSLRLKSNLGKDFAAAVYFSEAPSPPYLFSGGGQAILQNLNMVPYRV
jgi:hypothetical protein